MTRTPSTGIDRSRATVRGPDGVTKFYASDDQARLAAEKYKRLAALAGDRFRSPIPTAVKTDPPRVVFKVLPARRTSSDAIVAALRAFDDTDAASAIASSVGVALARLHDELDLPTRHVRSRAPALRARLVSRPGSDHAPIPLVFLHGDFGFSNVWVDDDGVPVIFDAEPSRYTAHAIDAVDYPEMDLATYVLCLGGRSGNHRDAVQLWRAAPLLVPAFLHAYRDARRDPAQAYAAGRVADLVIAQALAYRDVAGMRSGRPVGAIRKRTARLVS